MSLKTTRDLAQMKAQRIQVFSNAYDFFLRDLEVAVLKKPDGKAWAREVLAGYDADAQEQIRRDLSRRGARLD